MKRKRNKQQRNTPSGLSLSVTTQTPPVSSLAFGVQILLVFCGAFGALYALQSAYHLSGTFLPILLSTLIGAFVFVPLYRLKRVSPWVLPVFLVLAGLIVWLTWPALPVSLAEQWNAAVSQLANARISQLPPYLSIDVPQDTVVRTPAMLWTALGLAYTALLGFFTVRRLSFLPVLLLTFLPLEACLYYGMMPHLSAIICFFACNASVLAMRLYQPRPHRPQKSHSPRTLVLSAAPKGMAVVSFALCIFFTGTLLLGSLTLAVTGYNRSDSLNELRSSIQHFDWGSLLPSGFGTQGQLMLQGDRKYDYKTDLTVEIPHGSDTVYLKNFTGSIYTGSRWKALSFSAYKEAPFPEMKRRGLTFSDLFAAYDLDEADPAVLTVSPEWGHRSPAFLPYGVYSDDNLSYLNDTGAKVSPFASSYTVSYDRAVNEFWNSMYPDNVSLNRTTSYRNLQKEYTQFANEYYTQLPSGSLERLKADAVTVLNPNWEDHVKVLVGVEEVRNYLSQHAEYTLSPGQTPAGMDFTDYFLYENHKGYCVHFATAGALMLRAMNIPCRYAEGYVVTKSDFEQAQSNGRSQKETVSASVRSEGEPTNKSFGQTTDTIELTDASAHAWVEVYLEGLGWFPCEMTPGMSGSSVTPVDNAEEEPAVADPASQPSVSSEPESSELSSSALSSEESSSAPASSASNTPSSDTQSGKRFAQLGLLVVCFILAVLLMLWLYALAQRRRQSHFHSKDRRQNVLALYGYLTDLLHAAHCIRAPEQPHSEFAVQIAEQFAFVDLEACQAAMNVILKAQYGASMPSSAEQQLVETFVLQFRDEWMKRQSKGKQLWLRYGRHL